MMAQGCFRPRSRRCAQGRAKALAHGVVRKVMKTLVLPEAIDFGSDRLLTAAQAAEIRHVCVGNAEGLQRLRQSVLVKLRIGARARHGADVSEQRPLDLSQEIDELADRSPAVTDGVEGMRHPKVLYDQRDNRRSAPPLCRAMWSVLSLLISYCGSSGLA